AFVKCTTGTSPKPVPVIVTFAPPAEAAGVNDAILPSTLNGLPVAVVPPAFVTEIGPSTAALGTVTLRVVPPAPIVNGAVTVPLNFTDVVPVKVFPFRVTGVPATASFGFGSPMILRLIFR